MPQFRTGPKRYLQWRGPYETGAYCAARGRNQPVAAQGRRDGGGGFRSVLSVLLGWPARGMLRHDP
jgi:hypothetical protein